MSSIENQIAEKIIWAWNDGCPVAALDYDVALKTAKIARRRWNSFERRAKKDNSELARILDLAKALAETHMDGGRKTAGPLMKDYEWLAEQISKVFKS